MDIALLRAFEKKIGNIGNFPQFFAFLDFFTFCNLFLDSCDFFVILVKFCKFLEIAFVAFLQKNCIFVKFLLILGG